MSLQVESRRARKTVDAVILSYCTGREYFEVNERCVSSLVESESDTSFNIIIVESNRRFPELGFTYTRPDLTVVIPDEPFRYHRFLNIGLARTKSDWVLFSNNDVVFHYGWLSEILKVSQLNPKIRSFCPFDRKGPYLHHDQFRHKPYHIGYRVPIEFVGWCYVVERSVFEEAGKFDERYDLYFGDNDFARTLKRRRIRHAMVPSSFVEHLGGYTTGNYDAEGTSQYILDRDRYRAKWGDTRLRSAVFSMIRRVKEWVGSIVHR